MEEGPRIKVAIIDRSAFARAALPRLIEADPQLEVAAVARDEEEGMQEILTHDPDVVLLGLGPQPAACLELLRRVAVEIPRPVLLLLPPRVDPVDHLRALESGAVLGLSWDVDNSPARLMAFQSLLAAKLKAFGSARLPTTDTPLERPPLRPAAPPAEVKQSGTSPEVESSALDPAALEAVALAKTHKPKSPLALTDTSALIQPRRAAADSHDPDRRAEVAVLGAGAGGVALLRRIVTRLPSTLTTALLGVIRLPDELLKPFAERLARDSAIQVAIAREGDPVKPGQLLLAPDGTNMGMVRTGRVPKALVRLMQPEPGMAQTPSFDVTLRACAAIYGAGAAGIILSGLSKDGVDGFQHIKARGGVTAVVDLKQAMVPHINRICLEADVVDDVLTSGEIVTLLTRLGLPV